MCKCTNNKNIYSCYAKIIMRLLSIIPFLYFSYVYSASVQPVPPIQERLLLITGLTDGVDLPCMAYIENEFYAITSAECAERIRKSSKSGGLKLNRQTGNPLLFTLAPDEGMTGIRRLKLTSPVPPNTSHLTPFGPPDVFLEPGQSTVDVWYPETGLKHPFFRSTPLLMVNGQKPRMIAPPSAPAFVSGTPVFERGSMCVLSANGRCFPYYGLHKTVTKRNAEFRCSDEEYGRVCDNDLTCRSYCQRACQTTYHNDSREPDELASKVYCGDETESPDSCFFYNDGSGQCTGMPCTIMLNCRTCSTSDGEKFSCEGWGAKEYFWLSVSSIGLFSTILPAAAYYHFLKAKTPKLSVGM